MNAQKENKFLSKWQNLLAAVVIMTVIRQEQRIKYCDILETLGLQGEEMDGSFNIYFNIALLF